MDSFYYMASFDIQKVAQLHSARCLIEKIQFTFDKNVIPEQGNNDDNSMLVMVAQPLT